MDGWLWVLGAACAVMVGMAKTGVPGLGILAVPLFALACGGNVQHSAGTLLPLLCVADCFAVFWYRRHASAWRLWDLLPWVICGMMLAAAVTWVIDPRVLRPLVGVVVLVMVGAHIVRKWRGDPAAERHWGRAALFGITAGFATTLANAAGPVMNLYLLSQALTKDEFMGTGAWFFFIINLSKIPIYLSYHPPWIDLAGLHVDLILAPMVLVGALCGRWIYAHIPQKIFEYSVLGMTVLAAVLLLLPGKAPAPAAPSASGQASATGSAVAPGPVSVPMPMSATGSASAPESAPAPASAAAPVK
jgi:uncharacterized membrane protein YfcA